MNRQVLFVGVVFWTVMYVLGWTILWVGIPGLVFFALLKYVTGWQL